MPSPDVASYVGLELLDVDAQQLLDTALANLAISFPDWTPREGNTEVVLLEEFAAMVEDDVYALNQLPGALTEVLLRLFGLTRDQGAPPAASVEFTVSDSSGYTIPQGTTVRLSLGEDAEPVDFTTDTDLVIPGGQLVGTVAASGAEATVAANGRAAGTMLELLDAITYVNSVELADAVSGGRVAEEGEAFLDRAVPVLSRLTSTLVRPEDVEAYVATAAAVTRVRSLDLYNPNDPGSTPGSSPGYVAVAVATAGGGSLSSAAKAVLVADLRNRMHAGLIVNVIDADVTLVNVTLRVLRFAAADDAAVEAAVTQALTDYLDPDAWAWGDVVRVNELIAIADGAAGVDTVLEVSVPNGDLALTGWAPLAKAGTITVVVEAPA